MAEIIIEPFDIKYLSDYYNEFDAEITKYQWPDPFESIDDAKELLQEFIDEMGRDETIFLSVLSETGEFMGSVEVHGLDEDCPELGVWIKKSEWGKGYAYQALKAALDIAMSKYGKTEFFYEADTRNVGSRKLLDKFKDEYDIEAQAAEALTTDSGKELELQGFILTLKEG
ncbi:MAG: GNAT family N-acetyltransferase [Lachnospiraceae bacterium]|nr:GNAT family N-acetyltransferase [Lachnospiraceae bacterium]MBR5761831.1 GNAT family N-acetyltransferase [Lachnospiraceae bacterium]